MQGICYFIWNGVGELGSCNPAGPKFRLKLRDALKMTLWTRTLAHSGTRHTESFHELSVRYGFSTEKLSFRPPPEGRDCRSQQANPCKYLNCRRGGWARNEEEKFNLNLTCSTRLIPEQWFRTNILLVIYVRVRFMGHFMSLCSFGSTIYGQGVATTTRRRA